MGEFLQLMTAVSTAVIAFLAFLVSVGALAFSFREAARMRRHERLSVTPRLTLQVQAPPSDDVTLTIRNSGLGPATIRRIEIVLDGEIASTWSAEDQLLDWRSVLRVIGLYSDSPTEAVVDYRAMVPHADETVREGDELELLTFAGTRQNVQLGVRVLRALGRVELRVRYISLYGEPSTLVAPVIPDVTRLSLRPN